MNQEVLDFIDEIKSKNWTIEQIMGHLKISPVRIVKDIPPHNSYDKIAAYIFSLQQEDKKPKRDLRLVIADGSSSKEYIEFLKERFNVIVTKDKEADLVLFTGGEDVNPKYYNQQTGKYTHFNDRRDQIEKEVYRTHMYQGTPMVGICRGNQFLAVMKGGKLIQHVEGHGSGHDIIFNEKKSFNVTSTHHQMVYPFDMAENAYHIVGYSKKFKSDTYLNGDNEEIDIPRNFVEVEIIKYWNMLGIQGHPEYSSASKEFRKESLDLIEDLVFNKEKFNKEINNKTLKLEQYHEEQPL